MTISTIHPNHANGKVCSKCKAFKKPDAFSRKGKDKYGYLKSACNECLNAESLAKYYANHEANKVIHLERQLARYHRDPKTAREKQYAWRRNNPDRVKAIELRGQSRKREYKKRYREINAERLKQKHREYNQRNAERIRERSAAYYRANKATCLQRIKASAKKKPEHYHHIHRAAKHRRKVRLVNNGPQEKFSDLEIFERDGWICGICRKPVDRSLQYPNTMSVSLDHIIPIARGGAHTRDNVQCAHFSCNSSKNCRIQKVA